MNNKNNIFIKVGLSALVLGFFLAISVAGLIDGIVGVKYSESSTQQALKNLQGICKLESNDPSIEVSLSSLSSYDKVHGTKLFYMANQLRSVSVHQSVANSDFVQLRIEAEKQLRESTQEPNFWCTVIYSFFTVILAPIFASIMTNITNDYIYPWLKELPFWAILKRTKSKRS